MNNTDNNYLVIMTNNLYIDRHINGIIQGVYSFTKYNTEKCKIPTIHFYHDDSLQIKKQKMLDYIKINKIQYEIRNLVNEPVNILNSKTYLEYIKSMFSKYNSSNLKITILDEKKLIKEKLNLILSVNKASVNPPFLVIIEFMNNKDNKDVTCLVGKGVMFDTGGLDLKPAGGFKDMKTDMAGTAIILGLIKALAEFDIKKNVIAVLPIVENDIGANATHPGDVIISHSGKSVEINNTDAEGRLILADAISYCGKFSPSRIIDIATLTGAANMVFKGESTILLGNSKKLREEIIKSSQIEHEIVNELELYTKTVECVKSDMSDVKNSAHCGNGVSEGAAFLFNFLPANNIPWVHADIAAISYYGGKGNKYLFGGATGIFLKPYYII